MLHMLTYLPTMIFILYAWRENHMILLKAENITKVYTTGQVPTKALDEVSLKVTKGEFLAIMGPSGSGKSTFLHILGALETPTNGRVLLENTDIYSLSETQKAQLRRRKIGFVFQFFNLLPAFSIENNITMPAFLDKADIDASYLEELMDSLSIKEKRDTVPAFLSGGQQQRVAIARAFINKPAVILADEPTGNLDTKTGVEVIDLIKDLSGRYTQTVIMITHNLDIAKKADRIVYIRDGKLTAV